MVVIFSFGTRTERKPRPYEVRIFFPVGMKKLGGTLALVGKTNLLQMKIDVFKKCKFVRGV
jgi:hypothetical protein